MTRIRIDDLPTVQTMTAEEMAEIYGAGKQARLGLESLEGREVPAAGITASITGSGAVMVQGTAGMDRIDVLRSGNDVVVKGDNHVLGRYSVGGVNSITVKAGAGDDAVFMGNHLPGVSIKVYGEAGKDALYGGSAAEWLYGGTGNDYISGAAGNDFLFGGAGNDKLVGGVGADVLDGGANVDYYDPTAHDIYADLHNSLYGPIRQKYETLASQYGANGRTVKNLLGGLTADVKDVVGVPGAKVNTFQHGAIYWSPTTGAHVVYGGIWTKFKDSHLLHDRAGQDVKRVLGLPTTDEQDLGGGRRVSQFQGGAIYWSAQTRAHILYGKMHDYFRSHGGANAFGLPTSEERRAPGGRVVHFRNGDLFWNTSTGNITWTPR